MSLIGLIYVSSARAEVGTEELTRILESTVRHNKAHHVAGMLLYRRLFEAAQDGILLINTKSGQIEGANPRLTKMLGYSRRVVGQETVGRRRFR